MANFTREAIKKSFMQLLNRKPVNKITVKDIAEECGINRNSFYYHFSDVPALIEEIFTEEAEKLSRSDQPISSIYEQLIYAINFAIENKTAIYHICNSANRELFEKYLERISHKVATDYIDVVSRDFNIKKEDKEVLALYYKCMIIGFVIDWIGSHVQYDICEKLRRVCELYDGSIQNALYRCEREKLIRG